jgi:hypothetical protein
MLTEEGTIGERVASVDGCHRERVPLSGDVVTVPSSVAGGAPRFSLPPAWEERVGGDATEEEAASVEEAVGEHGSGDRMEWWPKGQVTGGGWRGQRRIDRTMRPTLAREEGVGGDAGGNVVWMERAGGAASGGSVRAAADRAVSVLAAWRELGQ